MAAEKAKTDFEKTKGKPKINKLWVVYIMSLVISLPAVYQGIALRFFLNDIGAKIDDLYDILDADGSGSLDDAEVRAAMDQATGETEASAGLAIALADLDSIDFEAMSYLDIHSVVGNINSLLDHIVKFRFGLIGTSLNNLTRTLTQGLVKDASVTALESYVSEITRGFENVGNGINPVFLENNLDAEFLRNEYNHKSNKLNMYFLLYAIYVSPLVWEILSRLAGRLTRIQSRVSSRARGEKTPDMKRISKLLTRLNILRRRTESIANTTRSDGNDEDLELHMLHMQESDSEQMES